MRTEDGHIVQECLNGEPGSFGMLVDKYKEGIYAFAYDKLQSFQDAEDVTQEVFLQAYRGLRTLRRWESLAFWLYRIAYARCTDLLRIRAKRVDRELIEDQGPEVIDAPSLDSYRRNQLSESLREALDALPGIYREVLTLHYFGGMTIKDIASAIGASPSAIGKRLSRGRAQLKEEMIAMMNTAFEGQRLQAGFTFRIVESVKRIKINPMPRSAGLPWGLSLATGIAIVVMTLGSQIAIHQSRELVVFPGKTETLKVREIPVDILGAPGTSVISGKQGDIDGGGIDPRNPQNAFLMAPAKGGGTWIQKADMPTARCSAGSAVVDGKIYVIGGEPVGASFTEVVEEYDPVADTWTRRAAMLTGRYWMAAAAVDGIIYAIGGWDGSRDSSTVEAYDPATDTWTKKADMPTIRTTPTAAVVDGIIYVIGGQFGIGDIEVLSAVEAYNPATDTWTTKADMPTARYDLAACVIDGRIYASGGRTEWRSVDCVPTVEVYDPATDSWIQGSDMPWARYGHSANVVDGKMYIIGGGNPEVGRLWREGKIELEELSELFSTVDVYDPGTDTWTTAAPAPFAAVGHAAGIVDGRIYTIGGFVGIEPKIRSRVEEFTPGLPDNIAVTSPAGKLLKTWGEVKSE
ncbi:sigma-70 family RNA polymerase sigma factor [Candidatus Poribacteria bacterium]